MQVITITKTVDHYGDLSYSVDGDLTDCEGQRFTVGFQTYQESRAEQEAKHWQDSCDSVKVNRITNIIF
jgi:hypothetical protein